MTGKDIGVGVLTGPRAVICQCKVGCPRISSEHLSCARPEVDKDRISEGQIPAADPYANDECISFTALMDDTDSDDGVNEDFKEVEPFILVAGGRATNSSRSASILSGSLSPPPTPLTTTNNAFEAMAADCSMRVVALNSLDFPHHSVRAKVTARLRPSRSQGEFVDRSTRIGRNSAM